MARKTITLSAYQHLAGLLALAEHHERALGEIEVLARAITGEPALPPSGLGDDFTGDVVWGNVPRDVDALLRNLGVVVVEEG